MSLSMDRYTADRLPSEDRERIHALVPGGHHLTLTHGGREYTARLLREGEQVDFCRASTPRRAAEVVLARAAA